MQRRHVFKYLYNTVSAFFIDCYSFSFFFSLNFYFVAFSYQPIMPEVAQVYPSDWSTSMNQEGPSDRRFRIPGGALLYHPLRDARFPYIYRILSHPLVHSPQHFTTILIRVVDTSIKARISRAQFDKTLTVPLGPNSLMNEYGTLLVISIAIVF
jgi:hypothetical protein